MMPSSGDSVAAAVLKSTPEKSNFLLLTRLLIAGGTRLVRDIFDHILPPRKLLRVLTSHRASCLKGLVTKPEHDLLYPATGVYGKSENFDITLLFKLLREICCLSPPVSTGSWDKLPSKRDISVAADLARIKFYRNDIYAHTKKMEVKECDFSVLWKNIRKTMLRLAKFVNPTKEIEWKEAIDKSRGDPLTPEDKKNVKELKTWYLTDLEIKEEVDKLQKSVNEYQTTIENKVDDIHKKLGEKADDTEMKVGEIEKKTDNILTKVNATNEKANEMANEMKAGIQQILSEVKSAKQSNDNQEPASRGALNQSQAMFVDLSSEPSARKDQSGIPCLGIQLLPPGISICDSDIDFFAKFYDPSTRQWLLKDFQTWFNNPCDPESRAYMLMGDPGIGKSVMAAVLAKRMKAQQQLGAAFFCRHNDSTRRNPRYLISSVAYQLCICSTMYNEFVGGFDSIQKFVSNHELGVHELFTKLLQEPLSRCNAPAKRQLIIVDALDESQYKGHSELLDLITEKFPLLPPWIVFFITCRPEEQIQDSLEDFRPCLRICSSDGQQSEYFKKHCDDLKLFIKGKVEENLSNQTCNTKNLVEKISQKCEGLFLYARHIIEHMKSQSSLESLTLIDHCPKGVRQFYSSNFRRIFNILGEACFKELVGCAVVSPGPLPTSFISFVLDKLGSQLKKQEVLDTISLFFPLSANDDTLFFLHSLIPNWLCNEKEAREFFIDRKAALKILGDFMKKHLDDIMNNTTLPNDLKSYVLRFGVRFLLESFNEEEATYLYSCLTNLVFAEAKLRISRAMVYCLIDDYQICTDAFRSKLAPDQICRLKQYRKILSENTFLLSRFPSLVHQLTPIEKGKRVQNALDVRMTFCDLQLCSSYYYAISSNRCLMAFITNEGLNQFITILDVLSCSIITKVKIPFSCTCCHPFFSPDDDFVFLGRLDVWFSVVKGTFVDLAQFALRTDQFSCVTVLNGDLLLVEKVDHFCFCDLSILFLFWNFGAFAENSDVILDFLRKQLSDSLAVNARNCSQQERRSLLIQLNEWVIAGSKVGGDEFFSNPISYRSNVEEHTEFAFQCYRMRFDKDEKRNADSCMEHFHRQVRVPCDFDNLLLEELVLNYFEYHFCKGSHSHQLWHFKTGKSLQQMYSSSDLVDYYLVILTGLAKAWCDPSMIRQNIPFKSDPWLWYFFCLRYLGESAEVKLFQGAFAVLWGTKIVLFTSDHLYPLSLPLRADSFEVSPSGKWIALCGSSQVSASSCDMQVCNASERSVLFVTNRHGPEDVKKVDHDVVRFSFSTENKYLLYLKRDGSSYAFSVQDSTVLGFVRESMILPRCLFSDGTNRAALPAPDLEPVHPQLFLRRTFQIVGVCFFLSSVVVVSLAREKTLIYRLGEKDGVMFAEKNMCIDVGNTHFVCLFSVENNLIVVLDNTITIVSAQFRITSTVKVVSEAIAVHSCSCVGKRVLLCLRNGFVKIVDVFNQRKVESLEKLPYSIEFGCFVPKNECLVVLCRDYSVHVWDYVQQKCLETSVIKLPFQFLRFLFCTCSDNGDLLACCIGDTVEIFSLIPNEVPILKEKARLSGHCGLVKWCQFLKEGRYLVTHGVDCCVLFWDLDKQDPIGCTSFTWCKSEVVSVTVSPKEDVMMCALSSGQLAEIKLEGLDFKSSR